MGGDGKEGEKVGDCLSWWGVAAVTGFETMGGER